MVLSRPPVIIDRFPRPPVLALLGRRVRMDRKGRIAVRVRCVSEQLGCRVLLTASRARRTVSTVEDRATKARLKLPRKLRRAVLRKPRRGVLVRVRASGRDLNGLTGRASRRIRVLPPRRP